jgi:hypothetical protein
MGTFNVSVQAVGNHGCQREKKDGEEVAGCGLPGCVDCITREFVAKLKSSGASFDFATLTHWPGQPSEVRDDLLTKKRKGSF